MKKTYLKPEILIIATRTESLLASASGSNSNSATIGNNGENGQTGGIDQTDGSGFTQESKGNSLWEDDWDE